MGSQKSISSFFSKAATKKVEEKNSTNVDNEENQNPAKTKTSQDKSSPTLAKKRVGVIGSDSEDDSKENSKVLANKAKDVSKEATDEKNEDSEVSTLDADGLPPLRKTARNPAFKRKSSEESNEDKKKLKDDKNGEQKHEVKEEEKMDVEEIVEKKASKKSKLSN